MACSWYKAQGATVAYLANSRSARSVTLITPTRLQGQLPWTAAGLMLSAARLVAVAAAARTAPLLPACAISELTAARHCLVRFDRAGWQARWASRSPREGVLTVRGLRALSRLHGHCY